MTEPLRKQRKGVQTPVLSLVPPSTSTPKANEPESVNKFTVLCSRGGLIEEVSFEEFWAGSEATAYNSRSAWEGEFQGRATLLEALFPHLKLAVQSLSPRTARFVKGSLRQWWRLFDACQSVAPVTTPEDINDFHAALARQAGFGNSGYNLLLRLVNAYRKANALPLLHCARITEQTRGQRELPEQRFVNAIYQHVKRRVLGRIDRWTQVDALTNRGIDWSEPSMSRKHRQHWTEEDIYATLRGTLDRQKVPVVSRQQFAKLFGRPRWMENGFTQRLLDFYPSRSDVLNFLCVYVIRSGWNEGTALAIDLSSDDWLTINPLSPELHTVRAVKPRGGTIQKCQGLEKADLSPGNLIRALVRRNEPLRAKLREDLAKLTIERAALERDNPNFQETKAHRKLRIKISMLEEMIRSPWLFSRVGGEIGWLAQSSLSGRVTHVEGESVRYMSSTIEEINRARPPEDQIPVTLVASDFRDAWVAFNYRMSGYNWFVTVIAAGHKNIKTLMHYLRQRQWRAHSAKAVAGYGDNFWREVTVHKRVEPAVLKALIENGEVSEVQVQRWLEYKDRTRLGMGCKDFTHPPPTVDPKHVAGNGCRAQRCTLCHLSVMFDDSLHLIARRLAELLHTKETCPLGSWHESDFQMELEATEKALGDFDPDKVEQSLSYWIEEIKANRYIPFTFSGSHTI